jgi:PST family polysaccharide transporter
MSSPTLKESVVTGTLWVGLERWLNQILSLSIYVVLARLVGPTSFGLVALAGVYLTLIEVFVQQGFATALIQRKDLEDAHLDSAFWINLLAGASLGLLTILSAEQLAIHFGEPRLAEILRWLSGALVLKGLSIIPQAVLVREMGFRALAIRSLLATLAGGVVGLGMAWEGLGVWSLVGQALSNGVVGTTALWWATPWRPSIRITRRHLRDIYGFSLNVLGNELLWFGTQRVDQYLIGVRLGASSLGPYALVSRIIETLIELITTPVATVALPAFSRLQDEPQRLRTAFYKTTETLATISIPAFCGISILAPNFIPVFFGPAWSGSVPLLQIIAVSGVLRAILRCSHPLMMAVGRPGVYLLVLVAYSVLTVALCLLGVSWNVAGVALAISLGMCINSVVLLIVCRRLAGISFGIMWQGVYGPVIASGCMIAVVWIVRSLILDMTGNLLFIIISVPIAICVYITVMMIVKPEIVRELSGLILSRLRLA